MESGDEYANCMNNIDTTHVVYTSPAKKPTSDECEINSVPERL